MGWRAGPCRRPCARWIGPGRVVCTAGAGRPSGCAPRRARGGRLAGAVPRTPPGRRHRRPVRGIWPVRVVGQFAPGGVEPIGGGAPVRRVRRARGCWPISDASPVLVGGAGGDGAGTSVEGIVVAVLRFGVGSSEV
jgi:hypothetical protein